MNYKKYLCLVVIVVLALVFGVGYKTTNIKIVGTTMAKNSTWDVHFENFKSHDITNYNINNTELMYEANLDKPGDYYEFVVDVVNDGSVDAVIDNVTVSGLTKEQERYISYTITNNNNKEMVHNQVLRHNTKRKIKVRVEFSKDINNEDLLQIDQLLNLTFKINYKGADSTL